MDCIGYILGEDAKNRSLWFGKTIERYMTEGLLHSFSDVLDFYEGYWNDDFDVVYESGQIVLRNKVRD